MSHALVMSLETMVTPVHAGISASCTTPIAVTPDPATIESSLTRNEEVQPEEITIISSAFIALVESPSELLISIVDSADASLSAISTKVTAIEEEVRTWVAYEEEYSSATVSGNALIQNEDGTEDDPWTAWAITWAKYTELSAFDSAFINNREPIGTAGGYLYNFFIRFGNFITGQHVSKCEVKLYRAWPTTFSTSGQARRYPVIDPESSQWRDIRSKIHLGDYDDSPEISGTQADLVASYDSRSLRSAYVTQDYSAGNGAWIDEDLGYREGVTDEEIEACSVTTDITSLLQDLISNREWEDGNHITIFWEETTLAPPSDTDYLIRNGIQFAGGGYIGHTGRLQKAIPNWYLALPKLIITYSAEVENVVFIDPATSTASTAVGTITAGTTVLHPVARMSATPPDATVADIQQPIMSLLGVAKEYSNVVVYQNNVGEVFAVKGFGPAEPVNTATDDQIISLSSHASGYSNLLVYQKGDGSVVMKKDSRLSSPNSPASTQIISSHGFNLSSGKVVVITQDGDGDVKVKSDIT
ncbi:MAG: hypothetical protein CMA83_01425 [Euryarchaeota archaeon]|nr:hypothetical protein [Euryarchaeota archaeon]